MNQSSVVLMLIVIFSCAIYLCTPRMIRRRCSRVAEAAAAPDNPYILDDISRSLCAKADQHAAYELKYTHYIAEHNVTSLRFPHDHWWTRPSCRTHPLWSLSPLYPVAPR